MEPLCQTLNKYFIDLLSRNETSIGHKNTLTIIEALLSGDLAQENYLRNLDALKENLIKSNVPSKVENKPDTVITDDQVSDSNENTQILHNLINNFFNIKFDDKKKPKLDESLIQNNSDLTQTTNNTTKSKIKF